VPHRTFFRPAVISSPPLAFSAAEKSCQENGSSLYLADGRSSRATDILRFIQRLKEVLWNSELTVLQTEYRFPKMDMIGH
jgi:hypothetical protein